MEKLTGKIESMGTTHRASVAGVSATATSLDSAKRSAVKLARESGRMGDVEVEWADEQPTPSPPHSQGESSRSAVAPA